MARRSETRRRRAPFGARILGSADQSLRRLRVRVQLLLTVFLITTNLAGAVVVFVISQFVVPTPAPSRETWIAWSIAVPTYLGVAIVVGVVWGTTQSLHALQWATDPARGAPTLRERRRALKVPLQLTAMQLALWLLATVVFTLLAVIIQPSRAVATGLTVGIAAVVVCCISFLLTEFTLRPVAARAMADAPATVRVRGVGVGGRMVIFWMLGTAAPLAGLMVTGLIALVDDETSLTELAVVTIVVCGVVLLIGLFVTALNARAVVAPVLSVRDAMAEVRRGQFDADIVVYDGTELGLLQSGFNHMVQGLREREQIRDLFGRHVGDEVASAALDETGGVALGGSVQTVSVLFVDLIGSTTYATEHTPVEVVDVLNRFFGVVVDEVDRHHGLVNKFVGDAVLAIFGAPVELPDHAGAALATARSVASRLTEEVTEVGAGIGVATGTVVAGNVGHEQRFEYTVIGDSVNSAARLTELAKQVDGHLLATWDAVCAANDAEAAHWCQQGETVLRGRSDPTPLAVPRR
ncbi:adenylate/guanylate cyclase domain-containing protein [Nocardioides panacisoli]|uniref:adenylate/guanylate cyclase domain-containing protein n=1 Tax=Nocardioides panacisoli TaxID=627624 RepID=UPI001C62F546|nr:adenylate/guanylate cyclase domain-containing protein [Nocardioides panacisoli]QYJ03049.1 adenylate/guanylate cyclase domain-containing protein [Nocardioides panacisoli]